jgi:hypothetical protein
MSVGRRVRDLVVGDCGTVVDGPFKDGRWRVAWDKPTTHQDTARPQIPSQFYEWVKD